MSIHGVDPARLYQEVKNHLIQEGLKIVSDEVMPRYYDVKAYKGGVLNAVIGAIRDVEVMINGDETSLDVTLRTGAWGRDIAIPAIEGFILLGIVGGAVAAGAEYILASEFERRFWNWLHAQASALSSGKAKLDAPYTPPMVPHSASSYGGLATDLATGKQFCTRCGSELAPGAAYCHKCGAKIQQN